MVLFGPKRDKVTGEWRRLHYNEHYLYSSPNIIRMIKSRVRWAGYVARMGDRTVAFRVLVVRPERNISVGRPRRIWENNIKMDLQQVGWGGGDMQWIDLARWKDRWRATVNAVMNLWAPKNVGNLTSWETVRFSGTLINGVTQLYSELHVRLERVNSIDMGTPKCA